MCRYFNILHHLGVHHQCDGPTDKHNYDSSSVCRAKNPVLTQRSNVYQNNEPVNEECEKNEKCPQRLKEQQWHGRQTLACLVEQSHHESNTTAQYKQYQQQQHLKWHCTVHTTHSMREIWLRSMNSINSSNWKWYCTTCKTCSMTKI